MVVKKIFIITANLACINAIIPSPVVFLILAERSGPCQTGVVDQGSRRYNKANDLNNFIVKGRRS